MWPFDNLSSEERERLSTIETAEITFQIRESKGEIWITYNDNLVCPCSMLNVEPVEAVRKMRELYIERKNPTYEKGVKKAK